MLVYTYGWIINGVYDKLLIYQNMEREENQRCIKNELICSAYATYADFSIGRST